MILLWFYTNVAFLGPQILMPQQPLHQIAVIACQNYTQNVLEFTMVVIFISILKAKPLLMKLFNFTCARVFYMNTCTVWLLEGRVGKDLSCSKKSIGVEPTFK